jgi:hypothetical protein
MILKSANRFSDQITRKKECMIPKSLMRIINERA